MILRRWSWLIVLPLAIAAGATVIRFTSLERGVRRELGDELAGALEVARIEIESRNRAQPLSNSEITDSTFASLAVSHQIRQSRTSLLARRGDSVLVLATASRDTTLLTQRRMLFDTAPSHIKKALTARARTGGAGNGFAYERVIYATLPVQGTDLTLLREVDAFALVERMLFPLAIDLVFVASLVLFAFAYLRSQTRVNAMRREQELTQVRGDFLAAVSHELRTPLAQIRMFAELLRRGSMRRPEEMTRALNVIEKESSRLSILVDNVLNYASLRRDGSAHDADEAHETDVNRDVDYVIDAFAPLAKEKQVTLTADVEGLPHAAVDSQALRQVLLNFLENAVKYGPRGQTVTIGSSRSDGKVRVWVDDQGPGVAEEERGSIWTAFRRGSAAREAVASGSGIGLSVVRDLVVRHGGSVWVEDAPAGGARFVAEFEAVPSHAETATQADAISSPSQSKAKHYSTP